MTLKADIFQFGQEILENGDMAFSMLSLKSVLASVADRTS